MTNLDVAIIGATGYTGLELLRLLRRHPHIGQITLSSRQEAGKPVSSLVRQTSTNVAPLYVSPDDAELQKNQLVFFATPNGIALKTARKFIDAGCKVIDLSADFRLQNTDSYAKWYGEEHTETALLSKSVYGLVEINQQKISVATLVANPGCYASAVQLGLIPLLRMGLIDSPIIADVKSGVSGAGKKLDAKLQFHEANESLRAYNVEGHRHHPEIIEGLMLGAKLSTPPELIFTPHLIPMQRGIFASIHAKQNKQCTNAAVREAYTAAYQNCPFIHINETGHYPSTADVIYTNMVSIGFFVRPQSGIITILVALDNMMKGAAGQAIQNLNVMMGWDESTALI